MARWADSGATVRKRRIPYVTTRPAERAEILGCVIEGCLRPAPGGICDVLEGVRCPHHCCKPSSDPGSGIGVRWSEVAKVHASPLPSMIRCSSRITVQSPVSGTSEAGASGGVTRSGSRRRRVTLFIPLPSWLIIRISTAGARYVLTQAKLAREATGGPGPSPTAGRPGSFPDPLSAPPVYPGYVYRCQHSHHSELSKDNL